MLTHCEVHHLGMLPYQQAWELQEKLACEIAAGVRLPSLLLLEHLHTYTFGRRGQAANLLWDEAELQRRGVSVHWVDRGGDVTYHGPGQLVGYPLLLLGRPQVDAQSSAHGRIPQADYTGYLRRLEETLILALERLGGHGFRLRGLTGVWVRLPGQSDPAKIAAIGVKVDARGVSRHGFALNLATDLTYWEGIIACGIQEYRPVNLSELLEAPVDTAQVRAAVVRAFGEVFGLRMVEAGKV
jgi:lipoate-protein ligase B